VFVLRQYDGLSRPAFLSAPPVWAVCLGLALVGCGGGGGGEADSSSPAAPGLDSATDSQRFEPPENWETDPDVWAANEEYAGQSGLDTVNAGEAYARGLTGSGQIIGFIDTGLDESHPEFEGKNIALNDRSAVNNPDNAQLSHGTGVASIALGARGSGRGLHGVAFDADPAAWTLQLSRNNALTVNDRILNNAIRAIEGTGARIINQSWGYSSTFESSIASAQQRFLEQNFSETLNLISRGRAIHVWAAGNAGEDNPAISTVWPLFFPQTQGYSITVAALGADGRIGSGSNRCGAAREFCLAAPGGVAAGGSAYTRLARAGGGYRTSQGTSYAAPYVSGALALLMQAFGDQLTLPEYTARLLASANKTGIYASETIYGQGLLDIEAALKPIGDLEVPLPSGGTARPSESRIDGGLIPPDVLDRLRKEDIILLDKLNTPFITDLALAPQQFADFDLIEWLTHGQDKTSPSTHPFLAGFNQTGKGREIGNFWQIVPIALRRSGVGQDLPPLGSIGFAATVRRRRGRFEFGWVGEMDGLMNSIGDGALKLGPSQSALVSVGKDFAFGEKLFISTDAHFTFSHLSPQSDSLIRGTKHALASAFDVKIGYRDFNLTVSQPTYFESGKLKISRPHKRQADGSVVFRDDEVSLRSTSRPLLLSLVHERGLSRLGLKVEKHAEQEAQIGFAWEQKF